jgi:hypothetical protein
VRLDSADHLRRPFRVHELAAAEGLALHDVWQLEAELPDGLGLHDLEALLRDARPPAVVRTLFAVRRLLGRALRLDEGGRGFRPVYDDPGERLYRIANRTVTAFAHLALVERHARVAVYVRPHGRLGRSYLRLIEPFRRFVVYPTLIRWAEQQIERTPARHAG